MWITFVNLEQSVDGVVKIICQADPEGLPDKQNKEEKEQWDL